MLQLGWHAISGGPGCGKTHLLSKTAAAMEQKGRCVLVVARSNSTLFALGHRIHRSGDNRGAFNRNIYAHVYPSQHDLQCAGLRDGEWFHRNPDKGGSIILMNVEAIIGSEKIDTTIDQLTSGKSVTVLIEEGYQMDYLSVFGFLSNERFRSHVVICGDPWQSSSDGGPNFEFGDSSIMAAFHTNFPLRSDNLRETLMRYNIVPTFDVLVKSYRLSPQLCRWGNSRLYTSTRGLAGLQSSMRDTHECVEVYSLNYVQLIKTKPQEMDMLNHSEIGFAFKLTRDLRARSIRDNDIVVLTPYKSQADALDIFLRSKGFGVLCTTIDRFGANSRT